MSQRCIKTVSTGGDLPIHPNFRAVAMSAVRWAILVLSVSVHQVLSQYGRTTETSESSGDSSDTCDRHLVGDSGSLSSPNFPSHYNNDQLCSWFITVPEHNRVKLMFQEFKLEHSEDCKYDYLEVHDGPSSRSSTLGKFCGDTIPEAIFSSGSTMSVFFNSDQSQQHKGFSAKFTKVPDDAPRNTTGWEESTLVSVPWNTIAWTEPEESCGGTISAESGTITSPNYPEDYKADEKCTWVIAVPESNRVYLTFESFELEDSRLCDYDYLKVYDGPNTSSSLISTFCGKSIPQPIKSSGTTITLFFSADGSAQHRGFSTNFTAVPPCFANITSDRGEIRSPGYPNQYQRNERCAWFITVPENYNIFLSFKSFELESGSYCQNDYVEVRDGHDSNGLVLGKFCGSNVPPSVRTSGNRMAVTFHSDDSINYGGFSAEFTKGLPCIENITGDRGDILSPGFPDKYGSHEICTWLITVPEHYHVFLKFRSFQLEGHATCQYDYVEVRDGHDSTSPVLGKFCGSSVPSIIQTSGNKMAVTFRSDQSESYKGFCAEFYKGVPCGGNITADRGVLHSPNYPGGYGTNETCIWFITVPENHHVMLRFMDFEMEGEPNCVRNYLVVLDGHNVSGPVLGKFCGTNITQEIQSSGNRMTVVFRTENTDTSIFSAELVEASPPTPESSENTTLPPTPESSSEDTTEPPTPEPSEDTIKPTAPESSEDKTKPPTPESSKDNSEPPIPESSEDTTKPPTPESSEDKSQPPTLESSEVTISLPTGESGASSSCKNLPNGLIVVFIVCFVSLVFM